MARRGDIVSFHKIEKETRGLNKPCDLNCEHFAIISYIEDKNIYGKTIRLINKRDSYWASFSWIRC